LKEFSWTSAPPLLIPQQTNQIKEKLIIYFYHRSVRK